MLSEDFIVYSLSVYWLFHLVSRSDIMEAPRNWAFRVFPYSLSYPLTCAYCMSFWIGLFVGLPIMYDIIGFSALPVCLLAAPVFNLLLDLEISSLIKANQEGPEIKTYTTVQSGTSTIGTDQKSNP